MWQLVDVQAQSIVIALQDGGFERFAWWWRGRCYQLSAWTCWRDCYGGWIGVDEQRWERETYVDEPECSFYAFIYLWEEA